MKVFRTRQVTSKRLLAGRPDCREAPAPPRRSLVIPSVVVAIGALASGVGCVRFDDRQLSSEGIASYGGTNAPNSTQPSGGSGTVGAAGNRAASGGAGGTGGAGGRGGGQVGGANSGDSTGRGGQWAQGGGAGSTAGGGRGGAAPAQDASTACTGPASPAYDLIDDMEDGDSNFSSGANRHGGWWVGHDTIGQGASTVPEQAMSPVFAISPPRGASAYAIHFAGTGFTGPGRWATLQASLAWTGDNAQPYDASSYAGLRFFARGSGGLRLKLQTTDTTPYDNGGTCQLNDAGGNCYDGFGKDYVLQSDWQEYRVWFCELSQRGGSVMTPSDTTKLLRIQFDPDHSSTGMPQAWDYWIDDVSFVMKSEMP